MDTPEAARQERGRQVSVKDVAARAGVSWKTVSNVVNQRDCVRPATRARVQEAIDELGYRPNLAGRQLRSGRSQTIMLAVPDVSEPYFGQLSDAMIASARTRGLTLIIEATGGDPDAERAVLDGHHLPAVDGLILSPLGISNDHLAIECRNRPVVLLGEHLYDMGLPHVVIDNAAAARELTHHLLVRGRRRFAFIGTRPGDTTSTGTVRLHGVLEALASVGIELESGCLIPTARYSREEGEQATNHLLQSGHRPDAIICCNDLLAVGCLRALRSAGLRVPDMVAVAGWDNSPEGAWVTPSLTTVAPDIQALADAAVDRLLAALSPEPPTASEVIVGHRIIARESTAVPNPQLF